MVALERRDEVGQGPQVWVGLATLESREFRLALKGKNRFGNPDIQHTPKAPTVVEKIHASPWDYGVVLPPSVTKTWSDMAMNYRDFRRAVGHH